MTVRGRVAQLVEIFPEVYPGAHCELDYKNPLQLLIATILSAQCTDKRVNMVTPALFKKYPKAIDYAKAAQRELENALNKKFADRAVVELTKIGFKYVTLDLKGFRSGSMN